MSQPAIGLSGNWGEAVAAMTTSACAAQGPLGPSPAGVPAEFMTGLAANMFRTSGENYFQKGQAFMQSKMGFLSSESLHYYYNINTQYGASS